MTFDHSVNAADIVRDALLLIGGVGEDEPVSGQATTDAIRSLNNMVKAWQNQGFHLWTRDEVVVFGVAGQELYKLGPSDTHDHWAELDSDFIQTTVNGAITSGVTVVVGSSTGMAQDDFIGIEQEDGTRHWTTIDNIVGTTLTIKTAITDTVADNASVFTYTARPQRPLRPLHARRSILDGNDVPMSIEPLEEYQDQPNKTTSGTPVFISFKPTLVASTLYVWQPPGSVKHLIKLTVESPIADFDASSDEPNFPIEWAECLTYNLAVRLEPQYRQLDNLRRAELRASAELMLEEALMFDSDVGSWYLQPNMTDR